MVVGAHPIAVNPVTGAVFYDPSVLEDSDAVLQTLGDAKGDLVVASAADLFTRLPVGSNSQILTADSTVAAGMKWAANPSSTVFGAADHGYSAWTGDPCSSLTGTLLSAATGGGAGVLMLTKIRLPVAATITNLHVYMSVAGASLTAAQNFAGLFQANGTRVGVTAAAATLTAWTGSAGVLTLPLVTPYVAAAADYYVGWYYNGTTAPTFARFGIHASAVSNAGLAAGSYRLCTADTGLTTAMPASFGAQTASNAGWWVALS